MEDSRLFSLCLKCDRFNGCDNKAEGKTFCENFKREVNIT